MNTLDTKISHFSLDFGAWIWYTIYMVEKNTTRKKRSDRTHVIYEILIAGRFSYIGITAKTQTTVLKSVRLRFSKHVERARNEHKSWPLYKALKKYGEEAVEIFILETVRGKAAAHARECELIKTLKPKLNLASISK